MNKRITKGISLLLALLLSIQPLAVCAAEAESEELMPQEEVVEEIVQESGKAAEQVLPELPEEQPAEDGDVPDVQPDLPEEALPQEPEAAEDEQITEEVPPAQEEVTDSEQDEQIPEEEGLLEAAPEEALLAQEEERYLEVTPWEFDEDPDELLWGYIYDKSGFNAGISTLSIRDINYLGISGVHKIIVQRLAEAVKDIADHGGSTEITINHSDYPWNPGFTMTTEDANLIIRSLLVLLPYELYWYQKTVSTPISYTSTQFSISMPVVPEYRVEGNKNFVTNDVARVNAAIANAQSIVDRHALEDDYTKLDSYRQEICSLVSYDSSSARASQSNRELYGDPWQLISVFDGNASTNVVCEGYSKAFQHLFDLSKFDGNIACFTVYGKMNGGGHMWNIVHIEGTSYLTDITNCDSGMSGYPRKLFLCGASGSPTSSYKVSGAGVTYVYDTESPSMLDLFGPQILTLSEVSYPPDGICVSHKYAYVSAKAPTCEEPGFTSGYRCSACDDIKSGLTERPALGHQAMVDKAVEAACEKEGLTEGAHCARCDTVLIKQDTVPALGHELVIDEAVEPTCTAFGLTEGSHCSRCGKVEIPQEKREMLPHDLQKVDDVEPGQMPGSLGHYVCAVCEGTFLKDKDGTERRVNAEDLRVISVFYRLNGGENAAENPDRYIPGEAKTVKLADPSKEGYLFVSWYTSEQMTYAQQVSKITPDMARTQDALTFYAKWTPITYTLKFNSNGGSGTMANVTSVKYAEERVIPCKFTRTGWHFVGWNTAADGSGTMFPADEPIISAASVKDQTVTLYAIWEPNRYTVRFEGNGGEGSMEPMELAYGQSTALPGNVFTRDTWYFNGWQGSNGKVYADEASVANLAAKDGAEVVLTARWVRVFSSYKVYFDSNGGAGTMKPMVLTSGRNYTLTSNAFKKTGYVMTGWSETPDGEKVLVNKASVRDETLKLDTSDLQNVSITLYAQWEPVNYTLVYNGNGGKTDTGLKTVSVPMRYDTSTELENGGIFSRTGYTFVGWNTKSSGKGVSWEAGETVENLSSTKNAKVTLYAIWRPNNYTIFFDENGADAAAPAPKAAAYNTSTKLPANTAWKFGHRFLGWLDENGKLYKDKASVKNLTAEDDGQVTLTAQWAVNTYSVKFSANGGASLDKITFAQQSGLSVDGSKVHIPGVQLTRPGYVFTGWNTQADGQGTHYAPGMVTDLDARKNKAVLTLYAEWKYTITLNGNGSDVEYAESMEHLWNEKFIPSAAEGKTGYRLAGWHTSQISANAGKIKYKAGVAIKNLAPGTTLYAVWKPVTYKVSFNKHGATSGSMSTVSMTYNKSAVLTANAFRWPGHTFLGWALSPDAVGPDFTNKQAVSNLTTVNGSTVTLYAVWS